MQASLSCRPGVSSGGEYGLIRDTKVGGGGKQEVIGRRGGAGPPNAGEERLTLRSPNPKSMRRVLKGTGTVAIAHERRER